MKKKYDKKIDEEKNKNSEVDNEEIEKIDEKENKTTINKTAMYVLIGILIIFVLFTTRKVLILKGLQERANLYATNVNYYYKMTDTRTDVTTEVYCKDNVKKQKTYKDGELKFTKVEYLDQIKIFYENDGKITMTTEKNNLVNCKLPNMVETDNFGFTILNALLSNIKTETIDGKECYVINGFNTNYLYESNTEKAIAYIEKDTGLVVKFVEIANESGNLTEYVTTYEYEFGNVKNFDIAEPIINNK